MNSLLLTSFATAQNTSATPDAPRPAATTTVGKSPVILGGSNAPEKFEPLFSRYFLHYTQPKLPAMNFEDSLGDEVRSSLLVTNGDIRLSIKDAIALAVENNLDVESVRLLKPMARADQARAQSGQLLRNLPSALDAGQSSAAGPLATATPFGYEGSAISQGGVLSGLAVQLFGAPIPNTEPVFFATGRVTHNVQPLANLTVTGTNFLNAKDEDFQVGVRKGYFTGTTITGQFESLRTSRNAPFDSINPAIAGDASLRIDQHLLQGFGRQINRRAIYIARNNSKIADLTFKQQLILTVSQVLGLYYDLVSFQQQEQVLSEAAARSKRQLGEMTRRMDLGLVSQADVISMQVELESEEQSLADAQAQIVEQEATLKSVLTHAGLEDPRIVKAHIIPTDTFKTPVASLIEDDPNKIADRAIAQRVEVQQATLSLANKRMGLQGTRSALLPIFDVYVTLQNNALAGQLNRFAPANIIAATDPGFVGGFGSVLDQLARRNYPDYEVGFQLNIPLVNRAAQSDLARDQIDLRQQEISSQSLRNGIRLQAIKSALALKQASAQYERSTKARELLEQSLQTEQKMFDFGASDPTRLEAAQVALDRSRIREITALNTFARAQVNLQAVLNQTLEDNDIVLDEAKPAHDSSVRTR